MLKWFAAALICCSINISAATSAPITLLTADKLDLENFNQPEPFNISTDTSNLLLSELSQYKLLLKHTPLPRIEKLLQTEDNYCMFNRVKNPYRARHTLFSLPLNIYPGLRLYYLEPLTVPKDLLNQQRRLTSLSAVFHHQPNKLLGISKGRSYGEFLDSQVSQISRHNLYIRAGAYRFDAIIKMLSSGKIDYLIEFPSELNDVLHLVSEPSKLRSVAFANMPSYLLSYVACSDTLDNKQFIRAINGVLRRIYPSPEYYRAHSRYITTNELQSFNQQYQQTFNVPLPHDP